MDHYRMITEIKRATCKRCGQSWHDWCVYDDGVCMACDLADFEIESAGTLADGQVTTYRESAS